MLTVCKACYLPELTSMFKQSICLRCNLSWPLLRLCSFVALIRAHYTQRCMTCHQLDPFIARAAISGLPQIPHLQGLLTAR